MILVSRNILLILISLIVVSCKSQAVYNIKTLSSASIAFDEGYKTLNDSQFNEAAEYFTQVYFLNPEFAEAEKASCLEIYSLFMAKMFGAVVDACDFTLRLYPASDKVEFIHYMKALAYYVQMEPVFLDQANAVNAKIYFSQFISDYPKSKLIKFAKEKIIIINEHLAGKEMYIGRYYLDRNDPIAAVPRFQQVLMYYSQSNQVPEALYRLMESFMMIGIRDEVLKYSLILGRHATPSHWSQYGSQLLESNNIDNPTKAIEPTRQPSQKKR